MRFPLCPGWAAAAATVPVGLLFAWIPSCAAPELSRNFSYPAAPRDQTADDYHGTSVADPYRPLEDPDAPATRRWIEAENALTFDYLERIPERAAIHARLTELWDYQRYGLPQRRNELVFLPFYDGLRNQPVLMVENLPNGTSRLLLDPNEWSADGTVAMSQWVPSEDGRYLAYARAEAGSDWTTWHVLEVASGQPTGDVLRWTKFTTVAWLPDSSGFFYARFPEPAGAALTAVNERERLYFHRLGQPQEEDALVLETPDQPKWSFQPYVSRDGRTLLVQIGEGTDPRSRWWVGPCAPATRLQPLLDAFDAAYELAGEHGDTFYFRTDRDAPRGRVIAVHRHHPEPEAWQEVVPQSPTDTLRSADFYGGRIACHWLHDATSKISFHGFDGAAPWILDFDEPMSVTGISGQRDSLTVFYTAASFLRPERVFAVDLLPPHSGEFRTPTLAFDAAAYVTEQHWYTSKDGTRVPMFLVHRRGMVRDGRNPTYLYGYGGFNVAITPSFSVPNAVWLEMGGLLAIPNLRGGGEFGEEWHAAGTQLRKQNVFDDFIAAAEFLIAEGWTSRERLAIGGRSNGGLLVGACLTQRPELFAAALPGVGVLDMLRYHRFTIGWAWASDYGTSDDPEQFRALYAYSPLHNLRPGTEYPATLIYTADHDDRVVPAHSFKFAAALQAAQAGPEPILIRIDTRSGHGAGKPVAKQIEEWADLWAFLVHELEL